MLSSVVRAEPSGSLPNTAALTGPDDRSADMMDGLHRFIERKIAESPAGRAQYWRRDFGSRELYEKSVDPNRATFAKIIGLADERLPAQLERFGDDDNPALVAEAEHYKIYQVRWPVLEGVWAEGLLLDPGPMPRALVVVLPDADQTPEQAVGLAAGIPGRHNWPGGWPNMACWCSCRRSSTGLTTGPAIRRWR